MSAFCVFGISRDQCKKRAKEVVSAYDEKRRPLAADEYVKRIEEFTQELFDEMERKKQISPAFDAPQFCEDWISVGLRSGSIKWPEIMVRGQKVDKKGNKVVNKKGNPVMAWLPYKPQVRKAA